MLNKYGKEKLLKIICKFEWWSLEGEVKISSVICIGDFYRKYFDPESSFFASSSCTIAKIKIGTGHNIGFHESI